MKVYEFEREWLRARDRLRPITTPATITVSPSEANATVGGAALTFTATVQNSTQTPQWSLTGPGSLSATSGASVTYTPPASGSTTQTATLTASVTGASAQAVVTVSPAGAVTIQVTPTSANLTAGGSPVTFTATVQNSANTVTWAKTGVGTLSGTSGSSVTYTPPASVSGAQEVTLTATVDGVSTSVPINVSPAATDSNVVVVSSSLRAVDDINTYVPATGDMRTWYNRAVNGNGSTRPSWPYMTSAQRDNFGVQVADSLAWDKKYIDGEAGKTYWVNRTHTDPDGTTYNYRAPGPDLPYERIGQYAICRDASNKGLSASGIAFRATKELRYLSLACMDLIHARSLMKRGSGLGMKIDDGFAGWAYGPTPRGQILWDFDFDVGTLYSNNTKTVNGTTVRRTFRPSTNSTAVVVERGDLAIPNRFPKQTGQWLTYHNQIAGNTFSQGPAGTEIELEYGVVMGIMVAGLAAYQNRDKYCPINEPQGAASGRPPAYFTKAYTDALYIWEQLDGKFKAYRKGSVKETLPLSMSRGILHADMSEIVAAVCYAKMKGGANWRQHDVYKAAVRAWKLICAPWQKYNSVQPDGTRLAGSRSTYYQYDHDVYGPCYFWTHQPPRYEPVQQRNSQGQWVGHDSTGELPTRQTGQQAHLTTYTRMTWSCFPFLFWEGCGAEMTGLNEEFLSRCANGVVAGELRNGKNLTALPRYTDGNGAYPVPPGWSRTSGTDTTVTRANVAQNSYMALAPWDASGILEAYNNECWADNGGHKGHGAIGVAMACAAVRAGKLTPHTRN